MRTFLQNNAIYSILHLKQTLICFQKAYFFTTKWREHELILIHFKNNDDKSLCTQAYFDLGYLPFPNQGKHELAMKAYLGCYLELRHLRTYKIKFCFLKTNTVLTKNLSNLWHIFNMICVKNEDAVGIFITRYPSQKLLMAPL